MADRGSSEERDVASLPASARERLRARESLSPSLYVTDLSTGDLLALRQAGAEPLGQVMGCSVYAVTAPRSSAVSGELKFLTGALLASQNLALGRLRAEAALLNADGVVGVRLQRQHRGSHDTPFQEWKVTGTAIRVGNRSSSNSAPWLSGLSGTEYSLLRQAGYRPAGLVFGNCAYYRITDPRRVPGYPSNTSTALYSSYERSEHAEAIAQARHLALHRMEDAAHSVGADGIVGVMVEIERHLGTETYGLPDLFVHFFAMGTAITALPGSTTGTLDVTMSLPLR